VRRLAPRKIETCRLPIVLDPRVSGSLLRHLTSAINGTSIARGTSFLKTKMNAAVFAPGITVVEDPFRKRGLASKPVDGEGIAPRRRNLIDKGILTSWVLDLRSARQLGLASTGHAARGTSAPPSPSTTNVYMEAGSLSRADMLKGIKRGLYVTEFIGMGVNGVTGDYSRGAAGFMIEDGELTYPVSEVTVASNLVEMFMNTTPADDLVFRHGADAPTLRIDGCTIAGR
jgi:PmbA protein